MFDKHRNQNIYKCLKATYCHKKESKTKNILLYYTTLIITFKILFTGYPQKIVFPITFLTLIFDETIYWNDHIKLFGSKVSTNIRILSKVN